MKKLTLVLSVTILAFVAMSAVAEKASASHISSAVLSPVNDSGVTAKVFFFETWDGHVKVAGFSRKLFRLLGNGPFVSLFYHNTDCSGDPEAVMVGFWFKNIFGKGRLFEKVDLGGESFDAFGSISIRDLSICGSPEECAAIPADNLVACGVINH